LWRGSGPYGAAFFTFTAAGEWLVAASGQRLLAWEARGGDTSLAMIEPRLGDASGPTARDLLSAMCSPRGNQVRLLKLAPQDSDAGSTGGMVAITLDLDHPDGASLGRRVGTAAPQTFSPEPWPFAAEETHFYASGEPWDGRVVLSANCHLALVRAVSQTRFELGADGEALSMEVMILDLEGHTARPLTLRLPPGAAPGTVLLALAPDGAQVFFAVGEILYRQGIDDEAAAAIAAMAPPPLQDALDEAVLAVLPSGDLLSILHPWSGINARPAVIRILAPDGALRRELRGHGDAVQAWSSSRCGRTLLTGSRDQTVRLWSLD